MLLLLLLLPSLTSSQLTSYGFIDKQQMEDFFWEGVPIEFVDWFYDFEYIDGPLETIQVTAEKGNQYLIAPCALIMVFHMIVLSRKSMRTSSTNIFLIAIAFTDLVYILVEVGRYAHDFNWTKISSVQWEISTVCNVQVPRFVFALKWHLELIRDYLVRCSAWFGLVLTVVRCLAIRSKNPAISSTLITARFGKQAVLVTVVLCLPMLVLESLSQKIIVFNYLRTPPSCPELIWYPTFKIVRDSGDWYMPVIAILETILFNVIPSVVIIIFTVLLVTELREARRRSMILGNESVQTTKINILVILLGVQFVLLRGVFAVTTNIIAVRYFIPAFDTLAADSEKIRAFLLTINSFLHFLICVSLSSQYRDTVRNMLAMEKPRRRMVRISNVVSIS